MVAALTYQVKGFEELRAKLSDPMVINGPVRDFLEKSGRSVEARAKEKAPVDTGRLRASIGIEVGKLEVKIGSPVSYAPYLEFGTRPHFPPLAALQPWAVRHGFPAGAAGAYLVARKIAARGTEPQPYLIPALNESKGDIGEFLRDAASEIERRFGK